jgi:hypothetical protein
MLVLVSGAHKTVDRYRKHPSLGRLIVPNAGMREPYDGLPWAADNGCFTAFDEAGYVKMIDRLPSGGLFVTAPDVVGDHDSTMKLWADWAPEIRRRGLVAGFVLQDGCKELPDADAVFVGGTTKFKLSETVRRLVRQAKKLGLWIHMGRVNTRGRVSYAASIGCDSIDGSSASRWPDRDLPKMLVWAAETQ